MVRVSVLNDCLVRYSYPALEISLTRLCRTTSSTPSAAASARSSSAPHPKSSSNSCPSCSATDTCVYAFLHPPHILTPIARSANSRSSTTTVPARSSSSSTAASTKPASSPPASTSRSPRSRAGSTCSSPVEGLGLSFSYVSFSVPYP